MIILIIGSVIGLIVTAFAVALCGAAKLADEETEKAFKNEKRHLER